MIKAIPTVLIVDDENDLRELLVEQVTKLHYKVLQAADGTEAYKIIQSVTAEDPIDAVISDLNMPKLDGLALLRKVRELGHETPFVFLTGYADKEKAIEALRLGALDFLEKPCEWKHFSRAVARAAEYGVLLRQLEAELDFLCSTLPIPAAKLAQFRHAQKALLMLKKENLIGFKRSA